MDISDDELRAMGITVVHLPEPSFPVTPTDDNSVYLGDAVYATTDPGGENGMIVWTDRADGRHWMGLNGRAIEELYAFAKKEGLIK